MFENNQKSRARAVASARIKQKVRYISISKATLTFKCANVAKLHQKWFPCASLAKPLQSRHPKQKKTKYEKCHVDDDEMHCTALHSIGEGKTESC